MLQDYDVFNQPLENINQPKALISTLNAHSFNTVQNDEDFQKALQNSDILLPDGISIVLAMHILTGKKIKKIAGNDLFQYEMERLNNKGGKCFFLGSTEKTLRLIHERAAIDFPNILVNSYSPPFKQELSDDDTIAMVEAVNKYEPDVLFIGMTAPKQEKWAHKNFHHLKTGHVCCVGAVFDFYAGTVRRAPNWIIKIEMEWLYRLIKEPRRMWRRYLIGNVKFIVSIVKEKYLITSKKIPTNDEIPIQL